MILPPKLHSWSLTPREAVAVQRELAGRILCRGGMGRPRLAAGADLAFSPDASECIAAVVVWDMKARQVVEQQVVRRPVSFPYVPGLLTFREAPAILDAMAGLKSEPDVFLFDGQGYAHPRRIGLASHLGLCLERPSLGCAKSILVGVCKSPALRKGSATPLVDRGECIGMAVRTRRGVKPIYVSVGHRLSLAAAVRITLACCGSFRLPEPTRLADQLVRRTRAELGR
jgi:deoxyribonuclease V